MSEELSNAELVAQLEAALSSNENYKKNQEGLVKQNNDLQTSIKQAQSGVGIIYRKMLEVKKALGFVGKDQNNAHQNFKFRGIDQFVNHVHPILNKYGVGILTKVLQNSEEYKENTKTGKVSKNVRLVMEYTFFAEDGSNVSCQMPSEGVDTSDKATNKALSAALKYCLIQTFFVPTEDMAEADFDNIQISEKASESAVAKNTVVSISSAPKKKVASKKKSFNRRSVASTEVKSSAESIDL